MDVLADLLERSRARGAHFAHTTVAAPWGLSFPTEAALAVHAVIAGEAVLEVADGSAAPVRLVAGDLVLVRGDLPHRLVHAPGAAHVALADFVAGAGVPGSARRYVGGDRADAVFMCGAYRFEGDLCSSLLASLTDVVHLRPSGGGVVRAAVDLLAREMERDAPGQQTVLDRLLDVLLVHMLREHFAGVGDRAPAWFRALDDPTVGRALNALHADPAHPWTVATLAAVAGLSRAAFARRFATLVGEPPLEYLTGWRMALARERLRDTADPLAAIAPTVGYGSEFAFAAAFKRHHGTAPGRWRTQARAATPSLDSAVALRQ